MELKKVYLAQNLKFLRRLKDDTQVSLAAALGVRRNKVTTYEGGVVEPPLHLIVSMAQYFDVTVDDLLYRDLTKEAVNLADDAEASRGGKDISITPEVFQRYVKATNNVTVTMEGFKELITHKYKDQQNGGNPLLKDLHDLQRVINEMLSLNWEMINSLQGGEEE